MNFGFQRPVPNIRRLMAIGNLCLSAGLLVNLFVHPAGTFARNWSHAISGFLLGLGIATMLFGVLRARRCDEKRS